VSGLVVECVAMAADAAVDVGDDGWDVVVRRDDGQGER